MTPPTPFSGGCSCGAIRYESAAPPIVMIHCHCRDCQRTSGGPFLSLVVTSKDALTVTQGSPHYHATPSTAGGETHRGFCRDCGSPVVVKTDAAPHIVAVTPASLDDPSWFSPQLDVWTTDARSWDHMNPDLPKFETYPH